MQKQKRKKSDDVVFSMNDTIISQLKIKNKYWGIACH
jgi:hypothetical protein